MLAAMVEQKEQTAKRRRLKREGTVDSVTSSNTVGDSAPTTYDNHSPRPESVSSSVAPTPFHDGRQSICICIELRTFFAMLKWRSTT